MNLRKTSKNNYDINIYSIEDKLKIMANLLQKILDQDLFSTQFISLQPTYWDEPNKAFICGTYDTKEDEDGEFLTYEFGYTINEAVNNYFKLFIEQHKIKGDMICLEK